MQFCLYFILFAFGLMIGNFATTVFYRLPQNIVIYGFNKAHTKPPHCSFCGHILKWYEYLPLISIFTTSLKCNYCRHPIPWSYITIEHLAAILAVITFYFAGENFDIFIPIFCLEISCILSVFIFFRYKKTYNILTLSMIAEGALYRTLTEHTLENWIIDLGIGSLISLWLLKGSGFHSSRLRFLVHIILPASIWLSYI